MAEIQTLIIYFSIFLSLFFEVFLLITYLEVREELNLEKEIGNNIKLFPTVTIIVPCFNEEKTLGATMNSLLNLDYPKDKLSIILVNDGSTDGTRGKILKFEGHSQVSALSKENGGKHTALNLALEGVRSDLVGCLDADSFVEQGALKKIVPFFDDATIMAVTPSIKVFKPRSVLQHIQKIEYSWGIFMRRMLSSIGALYVTPGPFSIFRTQVFSELGGYRSAHQTEDMEMALRMQKHHYKIVNSHQAHVYTVAPANFKSLYKQRVRWAYGFLNNAIDYRGMFFNKNYGHIGVFILPLATTSIFSSLYLFGNLLWNGLTKIMDALVKFKAVGLEVKTSLPHFDWYFLNTSAVSFLTVTAILLTLVILYLSLKLSDGKFKLTRGLFYYMFLYVLLVPLWLTKAMFNTIFRRQVNWR